jgi:hypothetical protein
LCGDGFDGSPVSYVALESLGSSTGFRNRVGGGL